MTDHLQITEQENQNQLENQKKKNLPHVGGEVWEEKEKSKKKFKLKFHNISNNDMKVNTCQNLCHGLIWVKRKIQGLPWWFSG